MQLSPSSQTYHWSKDRKLRPSAIFDHEALCRHESVGYPSKYPLNLPLKLKLASQHGPATGSAGIRSSDQHQHHAGSVFQYTICAG